MLSNKMGRNVVRVSGDLLPVIPRHAYMYFLCVAEPRSDDVKQ